MLNSGKVQGLVKPDVQAFLGIPYAASTAGDNRWQAPQPVTPWKGVKVAKTFGPNCYQAPPHTKPAEGPYTAEFFPSGEMSEDGVQ